MAIIYWPPLLQQLLNEQEFGIQKGDTTIRSDMDVGPQKVRRRFTKSVDDFSCSVFLTTVQWTLFETFFNTILGGGTLPFVFNHPISQIPTRFRFKGQPAYRSIGGGNYTVSMVWERLP